jgi:phage terminase small subunit
MNNLTIKQDKFCLAYLETGNASEAYRRSYNADKMKDESIVVEASKMLSTPNIALRVKELQAELAKSALWSRQQSIKVLVEVARGSNIPAVISAIRELNAMHGWNAPTKVEAENAISQVLIQIDRS